jgi:CD2 antigen cytoplasmic tail-binding protein 2
MQAIAFRNFKPNATAIDAPHDKPPTDIELITHLASNLMSLGDADIYSRTYEEILRDVRRSGIVSQNWEPPSADVKYEYKWDVPGTDDFQTFGPFSEEEMRSWFRASYFGQAGEKVKIRVKGGEWTTWDELLA